MMIDKCQVNDFAMSGLTVFRRASNLIGKRKFMPLTKALPPGRTPGTGFFQDIQTL
ncbi:hypothetical protein ACFX5Q_14385 [Mesorhizobium sp. IMUNJ 23033]|uniref:hypothetical protein n=1 Tax=Mesorhizobium sp. IMUNJ 23033 TaxID=3378039 RepID=UPI00384B4AED